MLVKIAILSSKFCTFLFLFSPFALRLSPLRLRKLLLELLNRLLYLGAEVVG
jgi:hypothetical protein